MEYENIKKGLGKLGFLTSCGIAGAGILAVLKNEYDILFYSRFDPLTAVLAAMLIATGGAGAIALLPYWLNSDDLFYTGKD